MRLFRSRRGQIRGIDFSLSLIIFLLVMSQVLTLTITFIESARDFQETSSNQEFTQTFGEAIINSPGSDGTSVNWASTPTSGLGSDWTFGLSSTGGTVDPYKVGRIASNNVPTYNIDYPTLQTGVNLTEDFSIQVTSSINVTIENISYSGGSVSVSGKVLRNSIGANEAEVWIYAYDDAGSISEDYLLTGLSGGYSTTITANPTDFVDVVIIGRYGGSMDVTRDTIVTGTEPTSNSVTLLEDNDIIGSSIQVEANAIGTTDTDVNFMAFYPTNSLSSNYTGPINPTGTPTADNTWLLDMNIPPQGMVVFLVHEVNNGVNYLALTTFPTLINGDNGLSEIMGPNDTPVFESTVSQIPRTVRGIILEFIFTTWRN